MFWFFDIAQSRYRSQKRVHSFLFIIALCITNRVSFAQGELSDPNNLRLKTILSWSPESIAETGRGVLVAVIDSGVHSAHKALQKNLRSGWNFVDNGDSMVDYDGHGTAVTGIITQIAPSVSILPLVVAKNGTANKDSVVEAVIYAINHGASIINLSLTFEEPALQKVRQAVGQDKFKQCLFVIAAGNSSNLYPDMTENWDNVLIIAATNLTTPVRLASYSEFGSSVDIAAPAGEVNDGLATCSSSSDQDRLFNGTSSAAPVVTGASALLKERYPLADGHFLKKIILERSCHIKEINISEGRLLNIGFLLNTSYHCPATEI